MLSATDVFKVSEVCVHCLDFFFFLNAGVDLVCKGLGKASRLLPCSLSLLNQNNPSV